MIVMAQTEDQMIKMLQNLIKTFWSQFLQAFINILIGEVKTVVLRIIQDVNAEDITDSEKRHLAFDRIKEYVKQSGKNISDSSINLAIELSIKILKGDKIV